MLKIMYVSQSRNENSVYLTLIGKDFSTGDFVRIQSALEQFVHDFNKTLPKETNDA